ncbi:MAG: N-acetylglucosamine-6-phosphate deacetylase [Acidobacteriota bacterium]|nr:N-acetylglucosamine-6-phosphate deacetylase [Acidobacteriota bacterium]
MIVLAGADLVLPDRVVPGGSLVIHDGRIEAIESRVIDAPAGATLVDLSGHLIVPGFVDVHIHGLEGLDVLDGAAAIAGVAARLPKYGVTAFCPTSIACAPSTLAAMLSAVAAARLAPDPRSARVMPAHLESNFINPEWNGAQPRRCLRLPPRNNQEPITNNENLQEFAATEILAAIKAARQDVGIITLAPELPGGMDLVRDFVAAGHRVSIGHTGATYDEARAAIAAGVCHATHLFNRMTPMASRAPGVVGAVLESDAVAAELICDGFHVHSSLMAIAIRAKGPRRLMAITDATAGAGLAVGTRARLGDQTIIVTARTAELEDGTVAGSVLTMDTAFRTLVNRIGMPVFEAARMCASTPAAELGLVDRGSIAVGLFADLVVLGPDLGVRQTYIGGVAALEH